jgi:hypothetical protein
VAAGDERVAEARLRRAVLDRERKRETSAVDGIAEAENLVQRVAETTGQNDDGRRDGGVEFVAAESVASGTCR